MVAAIGLIGLAAAAMVKKRSHKRHPPLNNGGPEKADSQQIARDSQQTPTRRELAARKPGQRPKQENAQASPDKAYKSRPKEDPIVGYTRWMMIFTGVYAVISLTQLFIDNQPQIGILSDKTRLTTIIDKPLHFDVTFVNAGKSSASHVHIEKIVALMRRGELLPKHIFKSSKWDAYSGGVDFLPGQLNPTNFDTDFSLSAPLITALTQSPLKVAALFKVVYTDSFFIPHEKILCEVAVPAEARLVLCMDESRPNQ